MFKHINKNYYPEMVLLNIINFINCDYLKNYHQQRFNLNNSDQNIGCIS